MSHFVLVHGAWHGAWCWEQVVPRLGARGHSARAIDLPGHGQDPKPPGAVSFDDYMSRMGDVIEAAPEPPILVGHSLGGAVITCAADRWPERIRALVYLCAMLPDAPDFFKPLPAHLRCSLAAFDLRPMARCWSSTPSVVREAFYHDCSDADAARAAARLRPQPAGGFQISSSSSPTASAACRATTSSARRTAPSTSPASARCMRRCPARCTRSLRAIPHSSRCRTGSWRCWRRSREALATPAARPCAGSAPRPARGSSPASSSASSRV